MSHVATGVDCACCCAPAGLASPLRLSLLMLQNKQQLQQLLQHHDEELAARQKQHEAAGRHQQLELQSLEQQQHPQQQQQQDELWAYQQHDQGEQRQCLQPGGVLHAEVGGGQQGGEDRLALLLKQNQQELRHLLALQDQQLAVQQQQQHQQWQPSLNPEQRQFMQHPLQQEQEQWEQQAQAQQPGPSWHEQQQVQHLPQSVQQMQFECEEQLQADVGLQASGLEATERDELGLERGEGKELEPMSRGESPVMAWAAAGAAAAFEAGSTSGGGEGSQAGPQLHASAAAPAVAAAVSAGTVEAVVQGAESDIDLPAREDSAFSFGRGVRKHSREGGDSREGWAGGVSVRPDSAPPSLAAAGWELAALKAANVPDLQGTEAVHGRAFGGGAKKQAGERVQQERARFCNAAAAAAAGPLGADAATPMEGVAYLHSSSTGYPTSSSRSGSRKRGDGREHRELGNRGCSQTPASTSSSSGGDREGGSSSGGKRRAPEMEGGRRRRRVAEGPQRTTADPEAAGGDGAAVVQGCRGVPSATASASYGPMGLEGALTGLTFLNEAMVKRSRMSERLSDTVAAEGSMGTAGSRAKGVRRGGFRALQGVVGAPDCAGGLVAAAASGEASAGLRAAPAGQAAAEAGAAAELGEGGGGGVAGWLGRRTRRGLMQLEGAQQLQRQQEGGQQQQRQQERGQQQQQQQEGGEEQQQQQQEDQRMRVSSDGSGALARLTPGPRLRRRRRPPAKTPDTRVRWLCSFQLHDICLRSYSMSHSSRLTYML